MENPDPLPLREQFRQAGYIFLTILIAGPIFFTLADLLKG